jgi:hypothetical protein
MTEIKFSLPEELAKKMKKHPEINWDAIARIVFEKCIENLEIAENEKEIEELTKLSEHSLKEFLEKEPDLYSNNDLKLKY